MWLLRRDDASFNAAAYTVDFKGIWRYGLKITQSALDSFLEKTGDDMENIRNEMEKLASFCMGKEGITKEDVVLSVQNRLKIESLI